MKFYKIIATGFGSGYSPLAPGTAGSLAGRTVLYLFNGVMLNHFSPAQVYIAGFVAIVLAVIAGYFSIRKVQTVWEHDSPKIVIDEIAGVWIAAFAIPFKWQYYLYAFVLFRLFDITKPFFIKRIDNMKSSMSVMLDDIVAGIYSALILQLLIKLDVL
jgi:phosphatidylglycerophosphatase A